MNKVFLSVIIPAYNEDKFLPLCLRSLAKQTYKNFEVIVVDDGSTDNSKLKVKSEKLKLNMANLILLEQKHQGAGRARNLGAEKANGEILVFVDADMTFDKNYLKFLTKPIFEGRAVGTFHAKELVKNLDNVWAKCWNLNSDISSKSRFFRNLPSQSEIFRAILKKEFLKIGGFEPDKGYLDDGTLAGKLKVKSSKAKKAICYHYNPETLKEVFLSTRWIGRSGHFPKSIQNCLRYSIFNSLKIGLRNVFLRKAPLRFILFKIVYDFGVFVGIFFGKTKVK